MYKFFSYEAQFAKSNIIVFYFSYTYLLFHPHCFFIYLGVEPFQKPVDPLQFPAYKNYVFVPMDLSTIEKNIKKKQYGSTEAFLMDVKWILHNCIIFNSLGSKLTAIAKSLVKVCKHEMQEIENCPDCYLNAHTRKDSWFVAACVSHS